MEVLPAKQAKGAKARVASFPRSVQGEEGFPMFLKRIGTLNRPEAGFPHPASLRAATLSRPTGEGLGVRAVHGKPRLRKNPTAISNSPAPHTEFPYYRFVDGVRT